MAFPANPFSNALLGLVTISASAQSLDGRTDPACGAPRRHQAKPQAAQKHRYEKHGQADTAIGLVRERRDAAAFDPVLCIDASGILVPHFDHLVAGGLLSDLESPGIAALRLILLNRKAKCVGILGDNRGNAIPTDDCERFIASRRLAILDHHHKI